MSDLWIDCSANPNSLLVHRSLVLICISILCFDWSADHELWLVGCSMICLVSQPRGMICQSIRLYDWSADPRILFVGWSCDLIRLLHYREVLPYCQCLLRYFICYQFPVPPLQAKAAMSHNLPKLHTLAHKWQAKMWACEMLFSKLSLFNVCYMYNFY